jgi:uncharacterized protein (DUF2147 family)
MMRLFGGVKLLAGLALVGASAAGAAAPGGLDGRWVTQTGNVEIIFGPCGSALCGTVARVRANRSMSGSGTSSAPPPEIGRAIVTDLAPDGTGQWKGKIFDRESGKTYDCLLMPAGDTMTVRAYVVLPLFGKSQVWRRAGR